MHLAATSADQTASFQNIIKSGRFNALRKVYAHVTGIDIGSNITQSLDLIPFELSGFLPTIPTNDKKFPLHVVVDNLPSTTPTSSIGDATNPDDNFSQSTLSLGSGTGGLSISANTDTTLYTPTAGKTGYITSWTIYAGGASPTYLLADNASSSSSWTSSQNSGTGSNFLFGNAPFKVATKLVFRTPATGLTLYWGITYYEM